MQLYYTLRRQRAPSKLLVGWAKSFGLVSQLSFSFVVRLPPALFRGTAECNTMNAFQERLSENVHHHLNNIMFPLPKMAFHSTLHCGFSTFQAKSGS